jgi:hypothetical protein
MHLSRQTAAAQTLREALGSIQQQLARAQAMLGAPECVPEVLAGDADSEERSQSVVPGAGSEEASASLESEAELEAAVEGQRRQCWEMSQQLQECLAAMQQGRRDVQEAQKEASRTAALLQECIDEERAKRATVRCALWPTRRYCALA